MWVFMLTWYVDLKAASNATRAWWVVGLTVCDMCAAIKPVYITKCFAACALLLILQASIPCILRCPYLPSNHHHILLTKMPALPLAQTCRGRTWLLPFCCYLAGMCTCRFPSLAASTIVTITNGSVAVACHVTVARLVHRRPDCSYSNAQHGMWGAATVTTSASAFETPDHVIAPKGALAAAVAVDYESTCAG